MPITNNILNVKFESSSCLVPKSNILICHKKPSSKSLTWLILNIEVFTHPIYLIYMLWLCQYFGDAVTITFCSKTSLAFHFSGEDNSNVMFMKFVQCCLLVYNVKTSLVMMTFAAHDIPLMHMYVGLCGEDMSKLSLMMILNVYLPLLITDINTIYF